MSRVPLPPNPPRPVADLAGELDEKRGELEAQRRRVAELEGGLNAAAGRDRDALARALRAGEPDPGTPETKEAQSDLDDAQRRFDGLDLVVSEIQAELGEAIAKAAPSWCTAASKRRDTSAARARAALATFAQELELVGEAHATATWLRTFDPARGLAPFSNAWRSYVAPSTAAQSSVGGGITDGVKPNGDAVNLAEVLAWAGEIAATAEAAATRAAERFAGDAPGASSLRLAG
jgi:hypothetical protein